MYLWTTDTLFIVDTGLGPNCYKYVYINLWNKDIGHFLYSQVWEVPLYMVTSSLMPILIILIWGIGTAICCHLGGKSLVNIQIII